MRQERGSVSLKTRRWDSFNQSNEKKQEREKVSIALRDSWDNIKWTHIIGPPGGKEKEKEKEKGAEMSFEKRMARNFPKLRKETDVEMFSC